tara:strand:- start:200 stop:337 length:138 start_codon:yes stop_codon:yes gene_type:complete
MRLALAQSSQDVIDLYLKSVPQPMYESMPFASNQREGGGSVWLKG